MLSIEHSNNVDAAVRYFRENLAQADYYCEKTKIVGKWHGTLANELGLCGEVHAKDFESLLRNQNPDTGGRLTARNSANRRPMYDHTFSSCKSASLVYAITKDEEILLAHQAGVKAAMLEIEANLQTQMGTGKGKHYVTTNGGGIWAEFVHEYARPIKHIIDGKEIFIADPQLHSHCTLMNLTKEPSGRYRAVELSNTKKDGPYYESLYHSVFAEHLKKAGYHLVKEGKRWEIGGITRKMIEKFSGRAMHIEALAKERGIINKKRKARLGRLTRNDKEQSIPDHELPSYWKDRLSLSEYHAVINAKGKAPDDSEKTGGQAGEKQMTAERAVDLAIDGYMERNSAIREKRLLGTAIDYGSGMVSADEVKAEYELRENIIKAEIRTVKFITTKAMINEERKLIERAAQGRGTRVPLNPDYKIDNPILNEGQRAAIEHVLKSQSQIMVVSGDAGVGKTSLFQVVKKALEEKNKKLFAFAPSSGASRDVLRSKGFENADTVAMLLKNKNLQAQLKDQVVLIDEAGLIGVPTANKIMDIADQQGARIIYSGDWKQHNSVEAGDALKALETKAGLEVARVNEIVRQREAKTYKEIIADIAKGISFKNNPLKRMEKFEAAFDKLDSTSSITEIPNHEDRYKKIAEDYIAETHNNKKEVIVVSPTNKEKDAVTSAIRAELRTQDKLGSKEREFKRLRNLQLTGSEKQLPEHYQKNDVIEFHQNVPDFKAGERLFVEQIDQDGHVLVKTKSQEQVSPLPFEHFEHFSLYAQEAIALSENDKIRMTKNSKSADGKHELFNGQSYDVMGFDPLGNIKLSNGHTLSKNAGHFDYGFVSTSHAAQGQDKPVVMLAQSSQSIGAANMKQFYVSISRGTEKCKIYTDDKEELKSAVLRDGERMSALEVDQVATGESQIQIAQKVDYMARVRDFYIDKIQGFYEQKVKPTIESIKEDYGQQGPSQKSMENPGFEPGR